MNNIPLGLGAPDDPLYGVLDTELNFFYLVSSHQEIIKKAVATMATHRAVSLVLISDSVNWHHNQIDNSVCSNWGITYTPDKTCVNNIINHSAETNILINNLLYFLEMHEKIVSITQRLHEGCQEWFVLQLPPHDFAQQFVGDPWVQSAVTCEIDNYNCAYAKFEHELGKISSVLDSDINTHEYRMSVNSKLASLSFDPTIYRYFYEFKIFTRT